MIFFLLLLLFLFFYVIGLGNGFAWVNFLTEFPEINYELKRGAQTEDKSINQKREIKNGSHSRTHSCQPFHQLPTAVFSVFFSSLFLPRLISSIHIIAFEGWIMTHTNIIALPSNERKPHTCSGSKNRLSNSRKNDERWVKFYIFFTSTDADRFSFISVHIPGTVPTRWCFSIWQTNRKNFVFLIILDNFCFFPSVNCIIRWSGRASMGVQWKNVLEHERMGRLL